jgi:hypothetical protein
MMKQSIKDMELAQHVKKTYLARKTRLRRRHVEWLETLYAVHGEQEKVVKNGRIIDLSKLRPDDVDSIKVTHNYLFQSLRAMMATALQNEPTPVVNISRPGRDGRSLARSCERLLQWFYHEKQFREAVKSSLSWSFTCGVGFLGSMWDTGAAPPTWVPEVDEHGNIRYETKKVLMRGEDGDMVMSEFGTPLTEEQLIPKGGYKMLGDVRYFAPSPFDIFPDQVREWHEVKNLIMRQFVPKQQLKDTFGDKAKHLATDANSSDFIHFDDYDDPGAPNRDDELVLVLTYCEKPSMEHPEGRYCMVANNTLLHESVLPGGMLPVHPVYDHEHPAHLFGESALHQALSVQRDLNAAEADLKMDRRMHAHPRLIAEQGSLTSGATRVPNVPGAIIEVRPNAKIPPHFLQNPSLPSWVERAPERLRGTIEDITGAHGLTKGQHSGIMSGRQASVVLAADKAKWGPTVKSLALAVEHSSSLALMLWKEHGPVEKTIDVYGSVGSPSDVMVFYRDYIDDSIRVRIDTSAMMPYNAEIRRQQIQEAWQVGAIPDVRMYWKLMRHSEMGRLLGNDEPSRGRAREENDAMDSGMLVVVEQHEDHDVHVDEHLERMRDPTWYSLDDRGKQAYRQHIAQHEMFLQNAQNPVLAGNSPMPELPQEGGQMNNLPPTMTGANGQATMPGLSRGQEGGIVGAA